MSSRRAFRSWPTSFGEIKRHRYVGGFNKSPARPSRFALSSGTSIQSPPDLPVKAHNTKSIRGGHYADLIDKVGGRPSQPIQFKQIVQHFEPFRPSDGRKSLTASCLSLPRPVRIHQDLAGLAGLQPLHA